jgi:hypothetical protein
MSNATNVADMTASAEQRRLGRQKRREFVAGAPQTSEATVPRRAWRDEVAIIRDLVRGRAMRPSPPAAVTFGAVVGVAAGLLAVARKKDDDQGNVVSGDVAVHLLNRIELLTIRLQVRHARGGVPTEIDVHRVEADASSRASSSG